MTKLIKRFADSWPKHSTPGLMWPKIALETDNLLLAANHPVGVNAYIDERGRYLSRRHFCWLVMRARGITALWHRCQDSVDATRRDQRPSPNGAASRIKGGSADLKRRR